MKISINVKLYSVSYFRRDIVADVTKVECVDSVELGNALRVLNLIRPISMMFKFFVSSCQYLALLETLSYTVREFLRRTENWFNSIDYEDFSVVVDVKFIDKED